MRILIAVPTFETITPDTFKSIYGLDTCGHDCVFDFVRGYDCATARNRIAQLAMDMEVDCALMVDNDVVLPSDALKNLLEYKVDVCIGYYAYRTAENVYGGKTIALRLGERDYTQMYPAIELRQMAGRGEHRVQVHGGGLGCALIRTDVFQRLAYPWFDWVNYGNGSSLSEDLYFCECCNQHAIPIWLDTRVACGHLFRRVQWPV